MDLTFQYPVVLLATIIIVAGLLTLLALASRWDAPKALRVLIVLGVVGHVCLGLALQYGGLQSDAREYHSDAVQLSQFWQGSTSSAPVLTSGKQGWVWVLGTLYLISGPSVLLGICVNAVAQVGVSVIVYRTITEVASRGVAMRGAFLIWLAPAQWLWGSLPLREALVTLLISICALATVRVARSASASGWVLLAASLTGLLVFRGSLAIVVVAATIGALLATTLLRQSSASVKLLAIPAVIAIGLMGQVALTTAGGDLNLGRAQDVRSSQGATAATAFDDDDAPVATAPDLARSAFSVLPRVLVGPYPWEFKGPLLYLLPDAIYWWFCLLLTWKGARDVRARELRWPLLLPVVGLMLALAAYSGNYGTMMRLRAMGAVYLVPFVAIALTASSRDRRAERDTEPSVPL